MRKFAALIVAALVTACSVAPNHNTAVNEALQVSVSLEQKLDEPGKMTSTYRAFCSGTVIASGVILTNRHCVVAANGADIYVRFYDGRLVKASVLKIADNGAQALPQWGDDEPRATDAALLSVDPRMTTHIARINRDVPQVGDHVFAIGSPKGLRFTVTFGRVSFVARDLEDLVYGPNTWLQHEAPINPGNSGGGLFNERGELIGVNTLTGGDNLSLSVPIDHILDLFKDLV